MTSARWLVVTGVLAAFSAIGPVVPVSAGPDKVAFPENWSKGVMYLSVDKAPIKQVHEVYGTPASFAAARKGEPMPSGTVFVVVRYSAKLDAAGNPVKGADGRFQKDQLLGFNAMEKRTGWGTDYPADKRNGEWEYRAFNADKTPNEKADLGPCFGCHKPLDKQDFVQSYDKLKTAMH